MKAPPRLVDDARVSAKLRADLTRTRSVVEPFDTADGLAALDAAIAAGAGAAAAAPAAKKSVLASGMAAKIAAAVGASAVVATVATLQVQSTKPAARPQPARSAWSQPASPAIAPAPPSVAAPADTGSTPEIDRARREIAQLGRIKALLPSRPAQAYELAQTGHREFGQGLLHQEREGLAVLALWQLGQRDEAKRRSRAFVQRYPSSPLRAQIERQLQAKGDR